MTTRHRTLDLRNASSGTYYWRTTGVTKTASVDCGTLKECDDVDPGWNQDNYFLLTEDSRYTPVLNGTEYGTGGVVTRKFDNYPIGYRPVPPSASAKYPLPTESEMQAFALHTAAVTNPSTPHVSVPSFVGELKDVVSLFRDWGGNLLRKVAKGYITWRFAAAPMISDVQRMSKFVEASQQRFRYLQALADRKWVSRRCLLGEDTTTVFATKRTTVHSEGVSVTAYRDIRYTRREWATLRWKLRVSLPQSITERMNLADRLVGGITSYEALNTAWQLMPWTWLADWFVNMGDFIAAHNNALPAVPSGFCYMRTVTAEATYRDVVKPSWVALGGTHTERHVVKLRLIPLLDPWAMTGPSMPALTAGQWSILGSLAALKSLKAR